MREGTRGGHDVGENSYKLQCAPVAGQPEPDGDFWQSPATAHTLPRADTEAASKRLATGCTNGPE